MSDRRFHNDIPIWIFSGWPCPDIGAAPQPRSWFDGKVSKYISLDSSLESKQEIELTVQLLQSWLKTKEYTEVYSYYKVTSFQGSPGRYSSTLWSLNSSAWCCRFLHQGLEMKRKFPKDKSSSFGFFKGKHNIPINTKHECQSQRKKVKQHWE